MLLVGSNWLGLWIGPNHTFNWRSSTWAQDKFVEVASKIGKKYMNKFKLTSRKKGGKISNAPIASTTPYHFYGFILFYFWWILLWFNYYAKIHQKKKKNYYAKNNAHQFWLQGTVKKISLHSISLQPLSLSSTLYHISLRFYLFF